MPFSIGLRFYRVSVRRRRSNDAIEIGPKGEPCDLFDFMQEFVKRRTDPTVETTEPRTWFFEPKFTESARTLHGHISYGTHGFESKIKDVKTRKEKYKRQTTDLEEVPLYYQIWVPSDTFYALIAFQSFQGRSCVTFVRNSMTKLFAEFYPSYYLNFSIVSNSDSLFDEAPVKSVTYYNPKSTSDRANNYYLGKPVEPFDYEVKVFARKRNAFLASYKELRDAMPMSGGVVEFHGDAFENVRADVKLGKKRRSVGIYGSGLDAGLIDVTETVKRDQSGHPTFASIVTEVDELMELFHTGMKTA